METEGAGQEDGGEKVLDTKSIIAKASATMDDEYDSRKGSDANYYTIAHTLKEAVTEQPSIMSFGTLKEYQVWHVGVSCDGCVWHVMGVSNLVFEQCHVMGGRVICMSWWACCARDVD